MYHIDRRVLVTLGLLSSAAVSAEAQSTSSGAECPMPVLGADAGGTMPTFMPDSTVRYFIRVMPAMCRNPLASTPRETTAGAPRPIQFTPEQATLARLWFERVRQSSDTTTRIAPRYR